MPNGRETANPDATRATFLATLAVACNVSAACRAANIGRRTAYNWREEDEAFAADWDAAIEEGVDRLEQEAWRRAHDGVDKPVTYQGAITATYKEYSDRMLEILLKAHRPEKYIERLRSETHHAVTVKIEGPAADL